MARHWPCFPLCNVLQHPRRRCPRSCCLASPAGDRPDQREAAPRGPRGGMGRIDHEVLPENGGDHLVLDDLSHDISTEGRRVAFAPVLVGDLKVQRVADDEDVLHRGNRVGVIAAATHHASKAVTDQEKGEELLVHPQAERRDPHANHVRRP